MATSFFKPVTSTISAEQESSSFVTLEGSDLVYTLCDRTNPNNKTGNYFTSFNLPYAAAQMLSSSTLSLSHPELYQLNVDQIVVIPIPTAYYDEHIDGRTVTLTIPQISGLTLSSKTIVSSTYSTLIEESQDIMLGSNIAYLFCDELGLPYTGTTANGNVSHAANSTWNTNIAFNRPPAVPYSDLLTNDINSDKRPDNSANYPVPVPSTYPTNTNQGYNYDIPVGFVVLDKGFIVITHPKIVGDGITYGMPWGSGIVAGSKYNEYFTDVANSNVTFNSVAVNFTTAVVCLALPAEFYFTNNPTWNLAYNLNQLNNGSNNFTPVYVTEVGLYNIKNELVARAKLSEPILKAYTSTITFNISIQV